MFVDHLSCSRCAQAYSGQKLQTLCTACSSPLLVRYDLHRVQEAVTRKDLKNRRLDMWRYRELLPLEAGKEPVSLGEGFTPLLELPLLAVDHGVPRLYVKDESRNPTGSFKDRGLAAAVTMAREFGVEKLAIPTAGNAGGALAAYGARVGLKVFVFMPKDTPIANRLEVELYGAELELIDGLITDAGKLVAQRKDAEGWLDVSTLKEPYRIEGKKTMGYELAEQLGWELPDVIIYPTGGGTGLIGMWKAFQEMETLGWISSRRPRMVSVQSQGCAPIVRAFEKGEKVAEPWPNPATFAAGIRVPKAIGDFLILDSLQASHGRAVAVSDQAIYESLLEVAREGIFCCPEGAACFAAFKKLRKEGWVRDSDRVVLFNTGSGLKYLDAIEDFAKKYAADPQFGCTPAAREAQLEPLRPHPEEEGDP